MTAYILLIIAVVLLGILFYNKSSTLNKKWYFYIVSFILVCLIGMRNIHIGADTGQYDMFFKIAAYNNFSFNITQDWEKGFLLLQFIVSRFTDHSYVFFTVIAIFYVTCISFFIYRNSSNPVLSYILFITMGFFTLSLTGIRQVVAFSFILLSYEFIKRRKLFLFVLFVIIAAFFHTSAMIFLIAYFISYKKFTGLYILGAFFAVSIITIFQNQIFNLITQFSKYQDYSKYETSGAINLTIMLVIIFIGVVIQKRRIITMKKENIILINMLIMTIILLPFSYVNPAALRIAYYFYFFELLLIPELLNSIENKALRSILYFIGIIIVLVLFFRGLQGSVNIPYRFFWQ